jgi:large subunit ribosomal protein L9
MKVFLLKDVAQVGKAGQIVTASDGYVTNFILPRKLGIVVTEANLSAIQAKMKRVEKEKDEQQKQTSALSEKIAALKLTLAKKMQEGGKLYGAINAHDVMELLAAQGISVSKSQVEFPVTIKTKGTHQVRVKLSNKLLPEFTLRVIEAAAE